MEPDKKIIPFPIPPKPTALENSQPLRQHGNQKASGGGDGGGSNMLESRVARLESDVSQIKSDVADMKVEMHSGFAQLRADFHESSTKLIMWIVGTGAAIAIGFITIMTFVLNNAVPKAPPTPASPPIIINVPPPAAPSEPPVQP